LGNLRALLSGLVIVLMAVPVAALEKAPADKLLAGNYSMIGLRLGLWADESNEKPVDNITIDADLPATSFFTEFFYDFRLMRMVMLELSMGIASRGDAVVREADDKYIGSINLYPLLAQLKISPLSGRSRTVCPFILGGGGVVWGRQNIDYITSADPFYNPDRVNNTETVFIGVVGGGVDFAISEQIGLNFSAKYLPISFKGSLAGVKEYTGISFAVGVAYYLHKKESTKP
jgi:hypothetical protein